MKFLQNLRKRKEDKFSEKMDSFTNEEPGKLISSDLSANEDFLRDIFHQCSDVVYRVVPINDKTKLLFVYIDGLCDTKPLDEMMLNPVRSSDKKCEVFIFEEFVANRLRQVAQIKSTKNVNELINGILTANVAILVEGETTALLADLKGFEKRSIEEPSSESVIRGPRDGFTETLRVNTSLIRRRIRSPRLKIESFTIGKLSKTDVAIVYIEKIASDSVIEEVRKRLESIEIDGVIETGFIEEFVEDFPFSPFPQVQNTERPDIVCGSLLEGKVSILVDNTPFVLIVPMTFWSGLQAAEDYYERFIYVTFIRWIRYILFNISLLLPSIYVAVITFHPQLIPANLLISIASAREDVPFPVLFEAIMMELMFEALREAGIRLPKSIGSAVSIVGALVIGEAAVQAGIISAPMVIVVAATGIASFAVPRYNFGTAYRLLRFPILIMAGLFGLYGVILGMIAILIHLVHLRSFGVPYLSPIAPQNPKYLKDVLVRAPRWSMHRRPIMVAGQDKTRIPEGRRTKT